MGLLNSVGVFKLINGSPTNFPEIETGKRLDIPSICPHTVQCTHMVSCSVWNKSLKLRQVELQSLSRVQVLEIFKNATPSQVKPFGSKQSIKSSHLVRSLKSLSLVLTHNRNAPDIGVEKISSAGTLKSWEMG